jgi:hypothetical protein
VQSGPRRRRRADVCRRGPCGRAGAGHGGRGPGGSIGGVCEPPSSSAEAPGSVACMEASLRNGSHSISTASGSLIKPNSAIRTHSDISVAMLLLPRGVEQANRALRARSGRGPMPALSAPRRVARAGRTRAARSVRRRALLGTAAAGFRRLGSPLSHTRPGAGRARRQPHRAHLHRRSLGRFLVRRARALRLRKSADLEAS